MSEVILRSPAPADRAALLALRRDKDFQNLLGAYPPDVYTDDVEAWLARRQSEAGGAFFVIADSSTDACLGFVQITNVHNKGRHGDFGIGLAATSRGRGIGRQAMAKLVDYAARHLKLRKLQLEVQNSNTIAIQLYLSMEFKAVGVRRAHYFDGSAWCDMLVMERIFAEM